jgi:hypothetical protein
MTTNLCPPIAWAAALCLVVAAGPLSAQSLDRTAYQWGPVVEWTLTASHVEGNPFDVRAAVTFKHDAADESRRTEMFYAGGSNWKFRFLGTRTGQWTFQTTSQHDELNGKRGTITVEASPQSQPHGFVTHEGNRWTWSASGQPFIPRIVMYRSPDGYYNNPDRIDDDLRTWFADHGFNGLHSAVLCRWFDLDKTSYDEFDDRDPNPDLRTFEALELLITKAHAAGGFIHLWAWGDESRRMTPTGWGINGGADQRLQRYIAARLGPLPGWTMGYGFDLWEWVNEEQILAWHRNLHDHFGWPHLVGGRIHRHGDPLDRVITDRLDYIGYETHRPDYETYVEALKRNTDRPVLMEDRFRVRDSKTYREKDYNEQMTRRGLWHSAMAGGVGNIWGYLLPDDGPHGMSRPYPNRQQLRTHATFFDNRFGSDLVRANELTDGTCLVNPQRNQYIFYKEDCEQIRVDLSTMAGPQRAVAVDALKPYREIDMGVLSPGDHTLTIEYRSDWAIAVGSFQNSRK